MDLISLEASFYLAGCVLQFPVTESFTTLGGLVVEGLTLWDSESHLSFYIQLALLA